MTVCAASVPSGFPPADLSSVLSGSLRFRSASAAAYALGASIQEGMKGKGAGEPKAALPEAVPVRGNHGEPEAADALRARIDHELGWSVAVPEYLQTVDLV